MVGIYGIPRVPRGYVARPRLCEALSIDSALIVVHGPAGSGKTVAVADWASGRDTPMKGVWFTVGQGSGTRPAFWATLAELVADAGLAPAGSFLSTGSLREVDGDDLRRVVLRAFAQLTVDVTIVVDDFRNVTDPEVAVDLIALLQANSRISLVVLTRAVGEFDSALARLSLDPVLVGPELLMFTPGEISGVLASSKVDDRDGEIARALDDTVAGSPLLVRGIVQAIARGEDAFDAPSLRETVTTLGSRLLRELMRAGDLGSERWRVLLFCSVPAVLTAQLVEELTGGAEAGLLNSLESEGLGIWSRDHSHATFTLSSPVRSAFRAELAERAPGEVARLSRIAAVWASEHGQPAAALEHAIEADDLDLASDVVLKHWAVLMFRHKSTVLEFVNPLPIAKLARQPFLAMLLAIILNANGSHKVRALEIFAVASASARRHRAKAEPPKRAILLLIESSALRLLGRSGAAFAAAERALSIVTELSQPDRDSLGSLLPTLLNHTGITYFYSGRSAQALRMFEAAVGQPSDERERGVLHAECLLAGVHAIRGDMVAAADAVAAIKARGWPEDLLNSYRGALFHVAEAQLALESLDFDGALAHIGLLDPHRSTIEHWPLLARIEAMARLGRGEVQGSIAGLEAEMERHSRVTTSFARETLDSTRVLLYLVTGQPILAERMLRGLSKKSVLAALGRARLELMSNRPEDAIRALLEPEWTDDAGARWRAESLLLRAAAALRLGRVDSALAASNEAMALMRENGLRLPVMMLPRNDVAALSAAFEQRGASSLVEAFGEWAGHPTFLDELAARVSLSERELVVLHTLVSTDSVAAIAGELFVSKNTVKSQIRSIYRKLGVNSRDEALLAAGELRLLS